MRTCQFDTTGQTTPQLPFASRRVVAEPAMSELADHARHPDVDLVERVLPPRTHAAALSLSSGGRLDRVSPALLQLQRRYGNRYVQQVVGHARRAANPPAAPVIQTKLTLGRADDCYERVADQVAQQVAGGCADPGLIVHRHQGAVDMVQRALRWNKGTKAKPRWETLTWADVESEVAVRQTDKVIALVIRNIAASPDIDLKFTDIDDLVQQATKLAAKPNQDLIRNVDGRTNELLLAHWHENNMDYERFRSDIDRRRERYDSRRIKVSGGPLLHTPQHDSNFMVTKGWEDKPANEKGREDAKWRQTKNTSGLIPAAKTGSVNLKLLTEQKQIGNVVQIGDFHSQICPSCGSAEYVESFEVDHQHAFSSIRNQFFALTKRLNSNSKAERVFRKNLGADLFDTYFTTKNIGTKKKPVIELTPSKAAVNIFSNDLDNLMRICRRCNGATGKSDKHYLDWYLKNDLFGPQFVRENLMDDHDFLLPRARGDRGWGVAARDWFEQKHLKVLQDLFHVRELQDEVQTSLRRESVSRLKMSYERNPVRQRELTQQTEQLERRNQKTIGITKHLTAAHTQLDLPLIGPGSPARDVAEITNVMVTQESSRKRRRMAENPLYTEGHEHGYSGQADQHKSHPEGPDRGAYQAGYAAGSDVTLADKKQGYVDAVTNNRTRKFGDSVPYELGFMSGDIKIAQMFTQGEQDGLAGLPLNVTIADPAEVGAAYLFQSYLKGYNTGFAARAQK